MNAIKTLNVSLSRKQVIILSIAVAAAAVVLALVTGDAEAACRHGGAPWDWTC